MEVLSIKKYNEKQVIKWSQDCDKAREDGRGWGEMPQLAFYVFNHSYGYVAFEGSKALWDKSKKSVIEFWQLEEQKKIVRGW